MHRRQFLTAATAVPLLGAGVTGAIAAPAANLWEYWTAHDPQSPIAVDHTSWQRFLSRYVMPSRDGIHRIAYRAVPTADRDALKAYLDDLATVRATGLTRDEQFAYWVNLYNALTIDTVLAHYPVDSIRDIDISPGLFANGPWGRTLIEIEGRPISLDDIEHRILRPIWRDPRIHYAVNCAALGCPNLAMTAYTAAGKERLLTDSASAFVNHDRGSMIADGALRVSSIYAWFDEDFGGSDAGIIAHLKQHARGVRALGLEAQTRIAGHAYDWRLNDKAGTP